MGVFFLLFATPTVRLFVSDPEVVTIAAAALRTLSYGNIGYAYGMVMLQAFNGAGDTVTPTIVNFFGFWLLQIPLAYYLALRAGWRANGAYVLIVVAECAIAAAGVVLFVGGSGRGGRFKGRVDCQEPRAYVDIACGTWLFISDELVTLRIRVPGGTGLSLSPTFIWRPLLGVR